MPLQYVQELMPISKPTINPFLVLWERWTISPAWGKHNILPILLARCPGSCLKVIYRAEDTRTKRQR